MGHVCLLLWLCFRFHIDFVKGGDVVFHFNPRFHEQTVVRNSQLGGYWGPEERDGMFPFIQGRQFEVKPASDSSGILQMFEFVLIQQLFIIYYTLQIYQPRYQTDLHNWL